MAVQGQETPRWLVELREIHLRGMKPEVQRTLIWLLGGVARTEIARREGAEVSTVKRWVEIATAEIASPLIERHVALGEPRGGWTVMHIDCCLRNQLEATA